MKTRNIYLLGVAAVFLMLFSFLTGMLVYDKYNSTGQQLDLYCKTQSIEMSFNGTARTTDNSLIVFCSQNGETLGFALSRNTSDLGEKPESGGGAVKNQTAYAKIPKESDGW